MSFDEQSLPRAGVFIADVSILDGGGAHEASIASLTTEELGRFEQMLSDERRRQFLLGRWLARAALAQWSSDEQWTIVADDRGRPHVTALTRDIPAPSISLSHSGNHVLCGLCEAGMVGVDVERPRVRDFMALARVVCDEPERAGLGRLSDAERLQRFYRLWTLKEACSKALGTGIATPLRRLVFDWDEDPAHIRFRSDKWQGTAQFLSFTHAPQTVAALALLAPGPDCRWRTGFFSMTAGGRLEPATAEILAQSA